MDIIARKPLFFSVKCLIFFIITLLILLCFVITVDIAGAREVYIILKNGPQKIKMYIGHLESKRKDKKSR